MKLASFFPVKKIFGKLHKHFLFSLIISCLFFISCSNDSEVVNPGDNTSSITYTEPTRLSGSPYPSSKKPDTLYIVEDKNFTSAQVLTIQSLQGILAQTKPRIYRLEDGSYTAWLNDLVQNYGVTAIYTYRSDFKGLLNKFKSEINGYILTNTTQPSIHYAYSLAGIKKSVVVTDSEIKVMTELGIPLLEDVKSRTYNHFINTYESQMNKDMFCYQDASKAAFLADYSIFGKAYYFYDGINGSVTTNVFSRMNSNAVLLGWGNSEDQLVQVASRNSIIVDAADWSKNLSTFTNIGVETKQASHNSEPENIENVHTVCFLMTDGDNIQWALGDFSSSSKWYGSPNRKQMNIGWTMSPAMAELAPSLLRKFYDTAGKESGKRDYFVAGPSGMGYVFPDYYADLQSYANKTNDFMKKADLRILNIIGTSINSDYLLPFLQQDQIDAIFYYYYSSYVGGEGIIQWVNNKPVITGRYQLWGGEFDAPQTLADKINILSTDITSSKSYSLIPVHVWTESVDDVIECVSHFNKNVRVVAPDEFVALIKRNVKH